MQYNDRNAPPPYANQYGAAPYGMPRTSAETQAMIDQGLRSYMLSVYNYMAIGLAVTGLAALGLFMLSTTNDANLAAQTARGGVAALRNGLFLTPLGYTLYASPLKWLIMLAPLGLVFFLSFRVDKMSVGAAQATFWIYAALVGVSLATVLMVFTGSSVARVFFITAASFGALSLWGYTTKRDLSGWGSFLFMGLIGIIIASIVNIFLGSGTLQWVISVIGVLVFSGLTAYDTQNIKEMYFEGDDQAVMGRKAIMGALTLYLDFINLFTMLLHLLGNRE